VEEVLASLGSGGRWKEHDGFAGSTISTQDFSFELLNCEVDEEARVAGSHLREYPFFALFVADCRLPCWQRDADCLDKGSIRVQTNMKGSIQKET
jgi:hypothetical protein